MKTAVVLSILGGLLMIGIATGGSLNSKIDRVEDKTQVRQERIENKIDKIAEEQKDICVAIGRIEEKLSDD